jgi:hypothetical protein
MGATLKNRNGSALPVVLIFAVIAAITALAYVSGQYRTARPALSSPPDIQALLNARSGIWKGLEMLSQTKKPDTLKGINTLDTAFNAGLFGKQSEAITKDGALLAPDGNPQEIQPYSCDSFGTCEVALSYRGCFEILQSKGVFRNIRKNVAVKLGGIFNQFSDTALFLEKSPPLQSPVRGGVHYGPLDTAGSVRTDDLSKFLSQLQSEMTDSLDTMKPAPPLLIQHDDEFAKVPDMVRGPLFIDGSHFDLGWKTNKRIVVLGDLQVTGTTQLEDMDFLVTGEIKLFDKARMRNVFLLSPKTISIGDRAAFSGSAVTMSNILVFGVASVEDRSMLVVVRKENAPQNKPAPGPKGQKKKIAVFSATFTESATIDATVVTLNDSLGIKIDRSAVVKGLLWTRGAISLDGKVFGRICASKIVDGAQAVSGKSSAAISVIRGGILPLEDDQVRGYFFPFFMGKLSIVDWREE